MPTPKTVSTDINSLLSAANKAAARTVLEAAPALGADDNYVTDAEKAALHSHDNAVALAAVSGTNTGNEDQTSILTKIGNGTRIGAEFMPDALSGEGVPIMVEISGVDYPGINGFLFPAGTINNRPKWNTQGSSSPSGDHVELRHTGLAWYLVKETSENYSATSVSMAGDPFNLSDWSANGGSEPTITAASFTASHIGQLYHDTTNNVWYRATAIGENTVWEEDAASVTIASLEALDATAMKAYLASLGVVLNA